VCYTVVYEDTIFSIVAVINSECSCLSLLLLQFYFMVMLVCGQ
jgi:hypothetical protein